MTTDLEQYRQAFEKAFDGMVFADDTGCYIDVNQSACELFGLEKDDLIGRSIKDFVPEDFDFEAEWERFQESGGENDTFPLVRADGEQRIVEYSATPNITPGVHLSILRDVTERVERERVLQETQSKFRQLVEQNLVGIYIIQDRVFSYVNPRLAEIFNETPDRMIGASPFEWIAEEDHDRVKENLRKREEGEVDSLKFTVSGKRSTDELFDFQVYGGRVEIDGEPAILGTLQDVTERKEHERQLQNQNERLEEFVNIVSHDLRNPLSIAQGNVELAQEEFNSDHLDTVMSALDRIDSLISDLLRVAREEQAVTETESIDLAEVLNECWENVDTKNAVLRTESTAIVEGSRSRLQQLGENLIRNAVEHGGDSVTILVGDLEDGYGFFIEDDGVGIPENERDSVFKQGYSDSTDGIGVGLSIVQRVAESHGWDVGLGESENGGARFEFTWDQSA